ncbi:MFS transporter [Pseudomonas sp.]|uniref:MFS transporter n=1 Tax=Pseudomonas sp. TaxID=306 RepID=UPI0028A85B25|nr:MFS transporter [Pseudomonas sp.]
MQWQRNLAICFFGSFINIIAMTVLLPFLPIYVEHLGATGDAEIARWSGIAYAATFLSAALVAPLWGHLADRYGSRQNLIRASFGMVVSMGLIGMAQNVEQLVALRLLVGLAGGYTSGSYVLVAAQTPKERSGWALGMLSSGIMAGGLVGPLLGGVLPTVMDIRTIFLGASGLIFFNFLATCLFITSPKGVTKSSKAKVASEAVVRPDMSVVLTMLLVAMILMMANMSIEPIVTLYVRTLGVDMQSVTWLAGLCMAASALGSILSAPRLGKLADRIGALKVVVVCLSVAGLLLIPQALVTEVWQLIVLRLAMGLALGGLIPCVLAVIRQNVGANKVGKMLGYATSAQYLGQVVGPVLGGFAAGSLGLRFVFGATSLVLLVTAGWCLLLLLLSRRAADGAQLSEG